MDLRISYFKPSEVLSPRKSGCSKTWRSFLLLLAGSIFGLLTLTAAPPVLADAVSDFNSLKNDIHADIAAGRFETASIKAKRLRRIAEGPLGNNPLALVYAVYEQASIFDKQGKYKDSMPREFRDSASASPLCSR